MSNYEKLLICNRGEIAGRIADAAQVLGITPVTIHATDDSKSLHTTFGRPAVPLPGSGVAAYLDSEAILRIARETKCQAVHPGYGFLAENAEFARACENAGIAFVGPSAETLALFGNKVRARALAAELGIPTIAGSEQSLTSPEAAAELAAKIGFPVMLKAAAGGGGRGMRQVHTAEALAESFKRASSEALAAFGDGALFIERLLQRPRHIEVQILADGTGNTLHLFERDCSVQSRHQKVIEIAPAPNLSESMRQRLYADAIKLTAAAGYVNAGTVEFLIDPETDEHFFIECNPRIQVEHTVTEQITGIDLVAAQISISQGATLSDLGLADQSAVGRPRGYAVQARTVLTSTGTITTYQVPSGAGVRVDANGYSGYQPPPHYDPLLAKVIGTSREQGSPEARFEEALERTEQALARFVIRGPETNIALLRTLLRHPSVRQGDARTCLIDEELEGLPSAPADHPTFGLIAATTPGPAKTTRAAFDNVAIEEDEVAVEAPMSGSVVSVEVAPGDAVTIGTPLIVVSAMKMESVINAPCAGIVRRTLPLTEGTEVAAGQRLIAITPDQDAARVDTAAPWEDTLADVAKLQSIAHARLQPGSEDPGVVRQRSRGKLTCRERIDALLDTDSFNEVGSITGFASYDEDGAIADFTPANHVGGWGEIEQRKTIVCADDFTSRGGHADGAIGAKSVHLDRLSLELKVPSVRLLDGSSGGGSVAAMVPQQKKSGESTAKESSGAIRAGRPRVAGTGGSFLPGHLGSSMYTEQLATVPVVNVLLGSVVGIGAAKAVLGHFSVMVRDIAQLFVAGPPVVSHAMGYDITKEELGGWHIHCRNGSVDNLAESEEEAFAMTRRFLSYLPSSVHELPPVLPPRAGDPANRREEELAHIIPRKRTTTFDVHRAIRLMADEDSFFEIGPLWGTDQITGLARFNGYPVGVIASDSQHANGGALTADGCDKLIRHLDMCELFHLPVLNLVDNPGFAVGVEHETASTIRRGGAWMVAFAQTTIPLFTVIMRRSFGVAGNNYATPRSRPSMRVTWPAADVGGIPPEGGIEAAYKRQLAEADDPRALRDELMARIESARGPIGPLSKFQMEEMIDPRDTRAAVCQWLDLAFATSMNSRTLQPRSGGFRP